MTKNQKIGLLFLTPAMVFIAVCLAGLIYSMATDEAVRNIVLKAVVFVGVALSTAVGITIFNEKD